jgi:hypothetical protein
MLFKERPSLVFSGLTQEIGEPRAYDSNLEEPSYFEREIDLTIPIQESHEFNAKDIQEFATPDELQVANGNYTQIKSLNTFMFDWKIKARVTKKHPKKHWKNMKTSGSLLNVELMDQSGSQI